MNIEHRRDLNHNYVILESPGDIDTGTYQVRMVISNDIEGLLQCSIRGMNGKTLFCYEITSRQSLKTLYEHRDIDYQLLIRLYEQIFQGLDRLEQFLLNLNDLVLIPDLILLNMENEEINFCFLPGYNKNVRQSLRDLMEYLLPKIDHKNQEAVMAGYGLYRKITEDNCSIESLKAALLTQKAIEKPPEAYILPPEDQEPEELARKKLLDEFFTESEEEPAPPWKRFIGPGITVILVLLLILFKLFSIPIWGYLIILITGLLAAGGYGALILLKHKQTQRPEDNFNYETQKSFSRAFTKHPDSESKEKANELPPLYGETEVLIESVLQNGTACLMALPPSDASSIPLDKDLILVGKLRQAVDGVLDSSAVSRIHAKIKRIEGKYYIGDLSSRNGTFVNGRPINGEEEFPLNDGDEINFADLTYRFVQKCL